MKSSLNKHIVERAQPWLGTFVKIRVEGLPTHDAHQAINAAFAEVAGVHHLMSFHEATSDVSRLNVHGNCAPTVVHSWTFEVLQWALILSSATGGCFDVSIGAELVDWHFLPPPSGAAYPPNGSWQDIELRSDGSVQLHRPLWIDLGGIAKGYAVDRATECLRSWGAPCSVVNAGGDIRVEGDTLEPIVLDSESKMESYRTTLPIVELRDGSIASSSGHRQQVWHRGCPRGPHIDGRSRVPAPTDRFVSVIAGKCIVADALTKVVIVQGVESDRVLREFGASAHFRDVEREWNHFGVQGETAWV
ncbi:MAG TPA: FAD:protein FMN transferase [Terriglobia bacterium]|nr:FAD:protein FMN transferase [Terriglobia bacterium]